MYVLATLLKVADVYKKRPRKIVKCRDAEYLIVERGNSKQPRVQQQIIRFNDYELKEWEPTKKEIRLRNFLYLSPIIICGVIVFVFTPLLFFKIISISTYFITFISFFIIFYVVCFFYFIPMNKKFCKETTQRRQYILSNHGNIPLDDVGTDQFPPAKYVILPIGDSAYNR